MAAPPTDMNQGPGPQASGGVKAMLPLILNIVLMPIIAFLMTQFVLIPKLTKTQAAAAKSGDSSAGAGAEGRDAGGGGAHGAGKSGGASGSHDGGSQAGSKDVHGGGGAISAAAVTVMLKSPVTVNVAGTMGSRLMMAKIGLRGTHPDLKVMVENRDEDLRDAAASLLQTKTLMDIERQGARNTIKSELKASFHKLLGAAIFTDVVIPDLAVQ